MMLTPCCPRAVPTGGAGVACPARICSLTKDTTFLRDRLPPIPFTSRGPNGPTRGLPLARLLDPCHLVEPQLHGGLPVEDVHQDLELALVHVDLADRPVEVGEGARDDPD